MKEIVLIFKTEKGRKAYEESEAEGKKASAFEKRAVRCLFRDSVICKDPLTVQIRIKSERMTVQIDLPKQIEDGLSKFGAVKDKDYSMDVK